MVSPGWPPDLDRIGIAAQGKNQMVMVSGHGQNQDLKADLGFFSRAVATLVRFRSLPHNSKS